MVTESASAATRMISAKRMVKAEGKCQPLLTFLCQTARRSAAGGKSVQGQFVGVISTSTRRFCARPLEVAFDAIGWS